MTTIADSELSSSGTYISLGTPAVLADVSKLFVLAYGKKTGTGGSGLAYVAAKNTNVASEGGWRSLLEDNSGNSRHVAGLTSTGTGNSPSLTSTAANVTDGGAKVANNTWQHWGFKVLRQLTRAGFALSVNGAASIEQSGASADGSGALISDATRALILLNRGPVSGGLGRHFDGHMAYVALYDELTPVQEAAAIANGPMTTVEGVRDHLYAVLANGTIYYGPLDPTNSITIVGRTTRVAGEVPPNTALGDTVSSGATVNGQVITLGVSIVGGGASGAGGATVAGQVMNIGVAVVAGVASGEILGKLVSAPLKNNAGGLLANATGVAVNVYDVATGALIVRLTGQTTDSAGVCTVIHSLIVPGVYYAVERDLTAAGLGRRLPVYQAI